MTLTVKSLKKSIIAHLMDEGKPNAKELLDEAFEELGKLNILFVKNKIMAYSRIANQFGVKLDTQIVASSFGDGGEVVEIAPTLAKELTTGENYSFSGYIVDMSRPIAWKGSNVGSSIFVKIADKTGLASISFMTDFSLRLCI